MEQQPIFVIYEDTSDHIHRRQHEYAIYLDGDMFYYIGYSDKKIVIDKNDDYLGKFVKLYLDQKEGKRLNECVCMYFSMDYYGNDDLYMIDCPICKIRKTEEEKERNKMYIFSKVSDGIEDLRKLIELYPDATDITTEQLDKLEKFCRSKYPRQTYL